MTSDLSAFCRRPREMAGKWGSTSDEEQRLRFRWWLKVMALAMYHLCLIPGITSEKTGLGSRCFYVPGLAIIKRSLFQYYNNAVK